MAKRVITWRKKMPGYLAPLVQLALQTTLYVVNQAGPTSFTLMDSNKNKYKISIGSQIDCSCHPGRSDHCLHSFFLLLKMFRVDRSNPILWQAGYNDTELKSLCEGKYWGVISKRRQMKPPPKPKSSSQISIADKAEQRLLEEEECCPICQEQMTYSHPLTFCRNSCGNNFHIKCMRIWGENKAQSKTFVTCPMCRCRWDTLMADLAKDQAAFEKTNNLRVVCKYCGDDLISTQFCCLYCEQYILCYSCFSTNKHAIHDRWLSKDRLEGWQPAADRVDFMSQQKKQAKKYIKQLANQKELTIQKFIEKYGPKSKAFKQKEEEVRPKQMIQYLCQSIPTASQHLLHQLDRPNFRQEQMLCTECSCSKMFMLRRLFCGHYVCQQCLRLMIMNQKVECSLDKIKFLKGYWSLLQQKNIRLHGEQSPADLGQRISQPQVVVVQRSRSSVPIQERVVIPIEPVLGSSVPIVDVLSPFIETRRQPASQTILLPEPPARVQKSEREKALQERKQRLKRISARQRQGRKKFKELMAEARQYQNELKELALLGLQDK